MLLGLLHRAAKPVDGFRVSRCLFVRLLALVYLIAFVSLWVQIDGLAGENGIHPSDRFLEMVREQTGSERFWLVPTLCWIRPGDAMLHVLCGVGVLSSILVIAGFAPVVGLFVLWVSYLSLASVCGIFLSYQWDVLLLEAGLLAVFFAPPRLWARFPAADPVPRSFRWLVYWLVFRLMFSSGFVKLAGGDPTWRSLTALDYHYETQPIPTWTAWYMHQLPSWFQAASVVVTFVVELVVPFFVFAPRRLRRIACLVLVLFQILLIATGNFAFFNLLSIVLCIPLLDDAFWPRSLQRRVARPVRRTRRWPAWIAIPVALAIFALGVGEFGRTLGLDRATLGPLARFARAASPLRSVNSYGLFASMTTSRPEIIVEGSNDGRTWLPYGFRYKPGDPSRRPRFVAPHQPRLDWQMWFAALRGYSRAPWFGNFLVRLLEGSPEVLGLLETNPFPEGPPRYVRGVVYDYRFTDRATREADGTWWTRKLVGPYSPVLSRRR